MGESKKREPTEVPQTITDERVTATGELGENTRLRLRLKHEVVGLVLACAAIFCALCLFSYNPLDPSINSTGANEQVKNLMGKVGAYLADMTLQLMGVGAFSFVFLLGLFSLLFFLRRSIEHRFLRASGFLIILIFSTAFTQTAFGKIEFYGAPIPSGGIIGGFLSELFVGYFNYAGAYLITITFSLIGLLLATDFTIVGSVIALVGFLAALIRRMRGQVEVGAQRRKRREEARIEARLAEMEEEEPPMIVAPPEMEKPVEKVEIIKRKEKARQKSFDFVPASDEYVPPPLDLLDYKPPEKDHVDPKLIEANIKILLSKLADFNVEGKVVSAAPGPVITMYEFELAPGSKVKVSQIARLSSDLAMAMRAESIRILAPIPGKSVIGIEVPNHHRQTVYLKEILASDQFRAKPGRIPLAIGKDISGRPVVSNLAKMPHLLIAGATGMGKSVGVNCILTSILYSYSPKDLRLLLFDPKMVELSPYNGVPHLLTEAITDAKKAPNALEWAVEEMETRYDLLKITGSRKLEEYNNFVKKAAAQSPDGVARIPDPEGNKNLLEGEEPKMLELLHLPYIVIVIDELADLMMVSGKEVEDLICRLAQKSRAAGIHLIVATQRPDVKVITGTIKANLPSRIAFRVSSSMDSRVILDHADAKNLLRNGDMLFVPPDGSGMTRVHGAFISSEETRKVIEYLTREGVTKYDERILQPRAGSSDGVESDGGEIQDEKYDEAVFIVTNERRASISYLQRRLTIGYNRAAKLIEAMEREGIVSAPQGAKNEREVIAPAPPKN